MEATICDPITMGVVSAGLGVAQAAGTYAKEGAAYQAQEKAYSDNKAAAQAHFSAEQDTLQQRQAQDQKAAAAESYDMHQEYVRAHASAENEASSSGLAGLSVESLLADLDQEELQRQNRHAQNLEWTLEDLQIEKQASGARMVDTIDQVPRGKKPSFGNLAIGIAGAGMQGYSSYGDAKLRQTKLRNG